MYLKDLFPIFFLLFLMYESSCVKQIYKKRNVKDKFVNLAAVPNYVYIGGSQTITLLNSSLDFLHEKTMISKDNTEYPSNWLMIPHGDVLIVCNYNSALKTLCIQYYVTNQLTSIDNELKSFIIEKPGSDFFPVIVEEHNKLFIASSECIKYNSQTGNCRSISNYTLADQINDLKPDDGNYNVVYKEGSAQRVNFTAALINDKFIYFLFGVNITHSKLGKICTNNPGKFNSYEDIPIQCNHKGTQYTAAMDAVFWSEQNYLFVTFSDDTTSVVCRYDLKSINTKFMESRKDRLKCPYKDLNNTIFSNSNRFESEWCFNATDNRCQSTKLSQNNSCPEVTDDKNGFCNTQFFGSVEGQLPLVSDNVIYSREHSDTGHIVKLDAITQKTYAVIYAGTKTGKLGKIFAEKSLNESTFTNFSTVEKSSPILDIKINGENVYVMTENLVVNVGGTEDCPNSGGCEDCMKSENPLCGWDVLQNTCNKNNNQRLWVPSAGRKCLRLITKDVQVQDNQESIFKEPTFTVEPDVDIPSERDSGARCTINGIMAEEYVQPIPSSGQKYYSCGSFEFSRSGTVIMALMYDGRLVVNGTLNLYKCPQFNSCSECVGERECLWCLQQFSCVTNAVGCRDAVNNTGESMCPRIDNSKSLFITENSKENVTMYVPKFTVYNKSEHNMFKCVVGNNKYNIAAKGDNVTCIDVIIGKEDNIRLQYNSSKLLDNAATLQVYQCQSLNAGKRCGYCKYLRSQNYKCDWCETGCMSTLHKNYPNKCPVDCINVKILEVYPPFGPIYGGTVITITGQNIGNPGDNILVTVYGVECTPVNVIEPSSKISCTTGNLTTRNNYNLTVSVNGFTHSAVQYYTYEQPVHETSLNFTPDRCILSGGRTITITGDKNYFNYADDSRFQVSFCNNMNSCINCRNVKSVGHNRYKITCRMDESGQVMELTKMKVIVDSLTTIELQKSFNVVTNPVINVMSPDSAKVFRSGGSKITINGKGFNDIDVVRMEKVDKSCDIKSDTSVVCEAPPYEKSDYERRRRSTGQNVQIKYDNYAYPSTIYYVEDPVIYEFRNTIDYKAGSSIVIMGNNLLEGATKDDYIVRIGSDGLCDVENITKENITCQPPSAVPRTNHSDANIVYVLVRVGRIHHLVGFLKYSSEIPLITILIGVLSAVVAVAILTISSVIFIMRRKKKIAEKNFQIELLTREERIREASREEFADAQMTIRDIKSDLVTSRVPFFDYQTYVFNQLFPNQDIKKHPLLQEPMIIDDNRQKVQEAMVMFDKLMTNKLFLKSVVQTLENQKGLSMQDKAHFACTLSVAFLGNMKLFYELVSSLLIDMIQSSQKKQHKVLFRRFDSITQRLMVNWLELSLYEHLKKQSGMQLFMLYKATQTVIEKGPIDAVTNHCRNTLAEERLLKNRVECETLTLSIDLNGNSDNHIPVTVLDCDTITQVKHKCITAIYKNKPASEVPTVNELELEWHQGRSGKLILQDKDKISDRSNGMVRLNTLKHYIVKNGSEMALMYKTALEDEADELYENQMTANGHNTSSDHTKLLIPESLEEQNQDNHHWHLSNLTDEEKSQDHEIGELFLNRLFHTKLILRDYIDAALEGIMDPQSLSVPVRYFLCMIDKQGKAVGVDSDVVQAWKSECYATRVWASLISRPQILFDVVVPSHVEPCMDILKQFFIDSFTQEAQNVSKESSTQKLLFFKDVLEYRKHVDSFFLRVECVSDQEFWRALDEISSVQSREIKFNRQATLHQLYNIVAKYKDEIVEGFGESNETKDLDFGNKLEKVSEKMEE